MEHGTLGVSAADGLGGGGGVREKGVRRVGGGAVAAQVGGKWHQEEIGGGIEE